MSLIRVRALALALLLVGCTEAVDRRPQDGPIEEGRPSISRQTGEAEECPRAGRGGYEVHVRPSEARPGQTIILSGAVPTYSKSGESLKPDSLFEVWWNADPRRWVSLLPTRDPVAEQPGPVLLVARVRIVGVCEYTIEFSVPEARPGSYALAIIHYGGGMRAFRAGRAGAALLWGPVRLRVVA